MVHDTPLTKDGEIDVSDDSLLREYFRDERLDIPLHEIPPIAKMNLWLNATVRELRGMGTVVDQEAEADPANVTGEGRYHSVRQEDVELEIDLDKPLDYWTISFDDDIVVEFSDSGGSNTKIEWRASEHNPRDQVPVRTSYVRITAADSASGTPTVDVQGYQRPGRGA